jgi:hypothetical protein
MLVVEALKIFPIHVFIFILFFSPTSNRKVLSHWTGLHGPARDLAFLGKTIEGVLGLKIIVKVLNVHKGALGRKLFRPICMLIPVFAIWCFFYLRIRDGKFDIFFVLVTAFPFPSFIFLISVKSVINFSILDKLETFWKKV